MSARCLLVSWLVMTGSVAAQEVRPPGDAVAEDLQPHVVGGKGTTAISFAGYLDRVYSSERILPLNYTVQIDVSRFVTKRFVVRGGLSGSGSRGGDDADQRPTGVGTPALHGFGGLFYYASPLSMWSLYGGAEYWTQLSNRDANDKGSLVGMLGLEGAASRRLGLFFEGGYGIGLTGPDEQTDRLVVRVGMRLKF